MLVYAASLTILIYTSYGALSIFKKKCMSLSFDCILGPEKKSPSVPYVGVTQQPPIPSSMCSAQREMKTNY